jgi:multisubunit Na+/H+ antiporter MnhG subunit
MSFVRIGFETVTPSVYSRMMAATKVRTLS